MAARFSYDYVAGEYARATADVQNQIAKAASAAVHGAGDLAKKAGRANIASAGFGSKWQNALRCNFYPPENAKPSINSAALVYHKIPYAIVFEEGATIVGKPLLWLPLDRALPSRSGGHRWTPKLYVQQVGPLRLIRPPGKRPLLVGNPRGPEAGRSPRLRSKGASAGRMVPLFVGIDTVTIGKKFDIVKIVQAAAGRLEALYAQNLKD